MSDSLKKRGSRDRSRISLEQEDEVRYWTKALGRTQDELGQAEKDAGGDSVEKVRAAFKR